MRYVKSVKMSATSEIHEVEQDSENGPTKADPEGLPEVDQESQRQKSPFTASIQPVFNPDAIEPVFNPDATPFTPPLQKPSVHRISSKVPILKVGPTAVPVNAHIWDVVANNRVLPTLPRASQVPVNAHIWDEVATNRVLPTLPRASQIQIVPTFDFPQYPLIRAMSDVMSGLNMSSGFNLPPPFPEDYSRNLVFTRNFGPVAHQDGYVELRLRDNISVLLTISRSVLVNNPNSGVRIAVSGDMMLSALHHGNGKIYQQEDRVDILAYSGTKNSYTRYAKMWDKGISLTADGCALIYLVDTAGTRTTSDAVNKDTNFEYCWQVFAANARIGSQFYMEAEAATKKYHFFTQDDGTQVFDILGYRVSQTQDGMIRLTRASNRLKIHSSPTNGSATLTTPNIHCTASMGQSAHLFVRRGERRMHFDGSSFVVRNAGHSAGFDDNKLLRVY